MVPFAFYTKVSAARDLLWPQPNVSGLSVSWGGGPLLAIPLTIWAPVDSNAESRLCPVTQLDRS